MIGALLAMVLAGQATEGSFDLICVGSTSKTSAPTAQDAADRTWHFLIDLTSRRYCIDECKVIKDIKDVQPTRLTFWDSTEPMNGDTYESTLYVDRQTGALRGKFGFRINFNLTSYWSGACEKKPFSGFPHFDTKF